MNLLYICTGNIFRSMSAEYLTREYLNESQINGINVSSAGTVANIEEPFPTTVDRLKYYGSDPSSHTQRKVSKEILKEQNIIICMGNNHKKIVEDLGFDCMLFNEVAFDTSTDVADIEEFLAPGFTEQQKSDYIIKTLDYIHDAIPNIITKLI